MPAIAESDDLYAWLIRGFVEAGLADHTRGGQEWTAAGALNLENFLQDQGAGGVLLQFRGQAHDAPSPEDDYTYQVVVTRGPAGTEVVVRSVETLFHHAFPDSPRDALAGHIVGQVRAHNDTFTEWRAKGGETTYAQRAAIPDARGVTADRALVSVIQTLHRSNRSVVEGPRNKWWTVEKGGVPVKIEAGLGQEPIYRTKKAMVTLTEEDLEHADRLRIAGTVLIVTGVLSLGFMVVALGLGGWNIYQVGLRGITAYWYTFAGVLTSVVFSAVHVVAGVRLRSLRSRGLVRIFTILGMLPCLAPCCGVGAPVGAWVLYLLQDARSSKVFES